MPRTMLHGEGGCFFSEGGIFAILWQTQMKATHADQKLLKYFHAGKP